VYLKIFIYQHYVKKLYRNTTYEELIVDLTKLMLKYYNLLSLADCFLIALAKIKWWVFTADQHVKNVVEGITILLLM